MHLTTIRARHIHNALSYEIELGQRVMLAVGPNEAGKSSLLGLAGLALVGPRGSNWPVLGTSPDYDFSVTATFAHDGRLSILDRALVRGKHTGRLNGRKLGLAAFNAECGRIGGPPSRFRIGDWLNLSPAKKFNEIRGLLPDEAVNTGALHALLQRTEVLGPLTALFQDKRTWWDQMDAPATATLERIDTDLHNLWLRSNQDAVRLTATVEQGLQDLAARGEVVGTPAALQAKIDAVEESIRALREKLGEGTGMAEGRAALERRIAELERPIPMPSGQSDDLDALDAAVDGLRQEVQDLRTNLGEAEIQLEAARQRARVAQDALNAGQAAAGAWTTYNTGVEARAQLKRAEQQQLERVERATGQARDVGQVKAELYESYMEADAAWGQATRGMDAARAEVGKALAASKADLLETELYRLVRSLADMEDLVVYTPDDDNGSIVWSQVVDEIDAITTSTQTTKAVRAAHADAKKAERVAFEANSQARSAYQEVLRRTKDAQRALEDAQRDLDGVQDKLQALPPLERPEGTQPDLVALRADLDAEISVGRQVADARTRAYERLNAAAKRTRTAERNLERTRAAATSYEKQRARIEGENANRVRELESARQELAQLADMVDVEMLAKAIDGAKAEKAQLVTRLQKLEDAAHAKAASREHQAQLEMARQTRSDARALRDRTRELAQQLYREAIEALMDPASRMCQRVLGAELLLLPDSSGSSQGIGVFLQRERDGHNEQIPFATASRSQQTIVASALKIAMQVRMMEQDAGWRALVVDDLENLSGMASDHESRRDAFVGALCDLVEAGLLDNVFIACVDDGWRPADERVHVEELTK